jgi:hypothetical protein
MKDALTLYFAEERVVMDEEWARLMEGYVMFEPTIMVFVHEDGAQGVSTAVVEGEDGKERALLVFQTYLEGRAYQEFTRQWTGEAIMMVDAPRIAALLAKYGLRWVAIARTFNEEGDLTVGRFKGHRFVALLERSTKG